MSETGQQQPQQPPTQTLAAGVEPCPQCGAMLAPDQRYCLNCGRRRGAPRLDFTKHVETHGTSQPPAQNGQAPPGAGAPPPEQRKQRDYAPLAAAGGIAVLGLILLVGVLIGRGNNNESSPTQPTQVVVPQPEGSETASNEKGKGSGSQEAKAKPSNKAKGGKKASKSVEAPPAITASENELKSLEEKSGGANYSEESAKLPNEIATPGKAPPEDNKAPGGGTKGTTIE